MIIPHNYMIMFSSSRASFNLELVLPSTGKILDSYLLDSVIQNTVTCRQVTEITLMIDNVGR